jgi:acyl-CoA thioesterase-1
LFTSFFLCLAFLLLPPAWIPWGLGFALGFVGVRLARRKRIALPALVVAAMTLLKGPYLPVSGWLMIAGLIGLAITARLDVTQQRPRLMFFTWLGTAALTAIFAWQYYPGTPLPPGSQTTATIVCLGDSLTAYGYPRSLAKLLDLKVLDQSADGISTIDGLARMSDVLAPKPAYVVIELGGHDYLKGYPRVDLKRRLAEMIDRSQQAGAVVVLFEIPCGVVRDPMRGVYRELALEKRVALIPDTYIRALVFGSPFFPPCEWGWIPRLSEDGIHPNKRGNELLAKSVARAIESIQKSSSPPP